MKFIKKVVPLLVAFALCFCAFIGCSSDVDLNDYTGPDGEVGAQGAKGETGDAGIKGVVGETGAKGDTGDQGQKGEIGDAGQKGETGDSGVKGEAGDAGAKGETGDQGQKGEAATEPGAAGLSAYEIYLKYFPDYEGDEQQWIDEINMGTLQQVTFTVSFDSDGGTEVPSQQVTAGYTAKKPQDPTRGDNTFLGWFDENDEPWNFYGGFVTEDITLTAKWHGFPPGFFTATEEDRARAAGTDIRVMSFNVLTYYWDANAPSNQERADKIATVITNYAPDVAGLQEVDERLHGFFGAADGLMAQAGYKILYSVDDSYIMMSTVAYNENTVTLLDKGYTIYNVRNDAGGKPLLRVDTWGYFRHKSTGNEFVVSSTHLDISSTGYGVQQAKELANISRDLANRFACPIIATGDFNAREGGSYYAALQENMVTNLGYKESKYDSLKKGLIIDTYHDLGVFPYELKDKTDTLDHIFYTPNITSLYYSTVVEQLAIDISDHCPIYADFKFGND